MLTKIITIGSLIADNWEYIMSAMYAIEKAIHMSKAEWNDLLIDGSKAAVKSIKTSLDAKKGVK